MYRATMQRIDNGETATTVLDADSIWHAMEEVVWEYSEDCWILLVEYINPPDDWDGRWVLTDTRRFGDVKYESRREALAAAEAMINTAADVLIAVPNKGD